MDTNMEKEVNKKAKEWWMGKGSLGSLDIDEKRLPLILAKNVKLNNFITRVEKIKARKYFDYQNGTVTIIELPTGVHETTGVNFNLQFMNAFNNNTTWQDGLMAWGAKSLFTNLPTNEMQEPDACFVPRCLMTQNPALNPCDRDGNPWPTIIFEVCVSETLAHIRKKINNYWLAPNRCEDVIVIKVGVWDTRRRNQTRRPLRRLQCLKFCRTATLQQNPNATTFNPIEEIEFGSVYANGRESQFCTGPHMKWITIDCNCVYAGCPQLPPLPSFHAVISSQPFPQPQRPPQLQGQPQGPQPQGPQPQRSQPQPQIPYLLQRPGVAIDLYDIQQAIFNAMGPI